MKRPNWKTPKPSVFLRAAAKYLGGTTVRFTFLCCGHQVTKDYSKGQVTQRMGEWAVQYMSRYWGDPSEVGQSGVTCGACPKCLPEHATMGIRGGRKRTRQGRLIR